MLIGLIFNLFQPL